MMTGWKTYALAAAGILLTVAHAAGYVNDQQYATLLGLIGSGGLATLRQSITATADNTNAVTIAAAPNVALANRAAEAATTGATVAAVTPGPAVTP